MAVPALSGTSDVDVLVFRPRRLRVLAVVMSFALCGLVVLGWVALPAHLRQLFTISQLLTLFGVLVVLEVVIVAIAASYVRVDAAGLRLRNGLRSHVVPWHRVHKIMLRPGDPWALLLLRPADGSPFAVDLDAEKCQLMGIQANDGDASRRAVETLRSRLRAAHG